MARYTITAINRKYGTVAKVIMKKPIPISSMPMTARYLLSRIKLSSP
jgi:hypothetical protein